MPQTKAAVLAAESAASKLNYVREDELFSAILKIGTGKGKPVLAVESAKYRLYYT